MAFYIKIATGKKIIKDLSEPSGTDLKNFSSQYSESQWLILTSNREFRDVFLIDLKKAQLLANKLLPKTAKSPRQKLLTS